MSKMHKGGVPLTGLATAEQAKSTLQVKSNYEVLKGNRAAVLKFTDGIIRSHTPGSPFSDAKIIEARKSVRELVAQGEWSKAIIKLDEIKDNRVGIVWHESSDLGVNGTRAIVRDARGVTTDPQKLKKEAGEKYAMQILNEVRGGLALVEKSTSSERQKEDARARLHYIAESAMVNIGSLDSKTIKEFNTQIIYSLEEMGGIPKAEKKLVFAKEVGNLKDEHCHIVTLTKAKDPQGKVHTVVEADIMLNGLTPEQRYQYETVRDSRKGARTKIAWFDALDDYKKDLVRDIIPEILAGKKVMPTQFLKEMPGIKNAYEKTTAIRGLDDGEQLQVLTQSLHSGTPATRIEVGKKEKEQIVQENIKQLQSFLPPDEKLNLNILYGRVVVPVPVINENDLYDQVHGVDFGNDVSVTASSINRTRHLAGSLSNSAGGGRDIKTYEEVLRNIADGLTRPIEGKSATLTPEAANYFKTGSKADKKVMEEAIADINDPKLSTILKTMVRCRELADANTIQAAGSDNINLEMTAKMDVIIGSAKIETGVLHGVLSEEAVKGIPRSADFCKSGKDRTGYAETKISHEAVNAHLGIDKTTDVGKKLAKENLLSQVAGNHTQEMAGVQAGSIGNHAIKLSDSTRLAKEDEMLEGIIDQDSAGFNSKIKIETGAKGERIKYEFEEDFQEHQSMKAMPELEKEPKTHEVEQGPEREVIQSVARQSQNPDPYEQQPVSQSSQQGPEREVLQSVARQSQDPDPYEQQPVSQSSQRAPELKSGVPVFMQRLYDDISKKQEIHKNALDVFKEKMKSATNAVELKAAMDEYRPYLESFEKDVAKFEEQQKVFEVAGASLHHSVNTIKSPESSGANLEDLKSYFENLKKRASQPKVDAGNKRNAEIDPKKGLGV
jgi:hypothetical protein